MGIPASYIERIYAGVLGKIIGVYLGRPCEGWTYERITAELDEVSYYIHEQRGVPLVVTDDISGTFTFLRALPDYGNSQALTPAQIGQTWLNYLIEGRTILWWGGLGNSTEHTAFLRLKHGIQAPHSGSASLNGKLTAEQIGAQIFIDGWAMVAPGDPVLAADLARRAGSVSHDGEAIYAAQALAAMEALAFAEPRVDALLDCALRVIPGDSVIARVIQDVRDWHAKHQDWRRTRAEIAGKYGYDRYGGNCHVVPNHALIILGLLYGESDFQRSLTICTTSGWDTDCNAGNLGCLLGIKDGLATLEAGPDWRGPVSDRLYLSSADGGRAITDAVSEAYHVANIGLALAGQPKTAPKQGARFHFELPGSVQGFEVERGADGRETARLENVAGHSRSGGRALAVHCEHLAHGHVACVSTPTFIPSAIASLGHYPLMASPTLYSGQTVRLGISAAATNEAAVEVAPYIRVYEAGDLLAYDYGPESTLVAGVHSAFTWQIPDLGGSPIAAIGLEVRGTPTGRGTVYLDYLGWDGAPTVTFTRPSAEGSMWRRAWVSTLDQEDLARWPESFRLVQNEGRGLVITGTREWGDYQVSAQLTPHLAVAFGIAARVQGAQRFYALVLHHDGVARLLKVLDGETILAETNYPWTLERAYEFSLVMQGASIQGWLDGMQLFEVKDTAGNLDSGGVALVCEEGCISTDAVTVRPV